MNNEPQEETREQRNERFVQRLEDVSREVSTWPTWKQTILGNARTQNSGQQRAAAKTDNKNE